MHQNKCEVNKRGRLKLIPEPNSYLHFPSVIQSLDSAYMHTFDFELGGVKFLVKIKLCGLGDSNSHILCLLKKIKEPEKRARPKKNKDQIPPGRTTAAAYMRIRLALAVQYLDSSVALIQPGLQLD